MADENKQMIEVTDANNKTFHCDLSKICDINGDIGNSSSTNITDSLKNRINKLHDVEYVDENGNAVDSLKILKDINEGKSNVVALDVEMEATHSGKNHNYCIYYEDSMAKDAESFMNPFRKPMLKNHDAHSEPLGRITQSWQGPSALTDERSAIHLKVRVTDKDAIPKFLDGRYGTVSIGGSMGTVTCNICGKTILKDGKFKFCGHWRGETYKDQVCYWGAKDIEYHEVSTVNTPADDFAQIMKVTVITNSSEKSDNKDNKEDKTMQESTTKNTDVQAVKQGFAAVADMIEELLSKSTTDSSTPNTNATEPIVAANNDTNASNNAQVNDATKEFETVKKALDEANDKIASLTKELEDSKSALVAVQTDLEDAKKETELFKDKCVTLATANKELIVGSICDKEIVAGKLTVENKDARKTELMAQSTKDLIKMAEEPIISDSSKPARPIAGVTNPTLVNPDSAQKNNDSNGSADTNITNINDKTGKKKTVDDFAQDIVSKFFNN